MDEALSVDVLQAGSQLVTEPVRVLGADRGRFGRAAGGVGPRGQQELLQVTLRGGYQVRTGRQVSIHSVRSPVKVISDGAVPRKRER